jgi:hypothetical protein
MFVETIGTRCNFHIFHKNLHLGLSKCRQHRNFRHFEHSNFPDGEDMVFLPFGKRYFLNVIEFVDSIAIFGISSIPIFRIEKDMVSPPFVKRYFINVIEFSGLSITG